MSNTVVIPVTDALFWRCLPNAIHAGTVEFADIWQGRPRCPVCGRPK